MRLCDCGAWASLDIGTCLGCWYRIRMNVSIEGADEIRKTQQREMRAVREANERARRVLTASMPEVLAETHPAHTERTHYASVGWWTWPELVAMELERLESLRPTPPDANAVRQDGA